MAGHTKPLGLDSWRAFILGLVVSSLNIYLTLAQTCTDAIPCATGCCSRNYQCGFTSDHCGDGCRSNCNATAECGKYATKEDFDCPINVCCSEWGFCGATADFCGDGCQKNSNGGGCGQPSRPEEPENTDALSYQRRIGYYELFSVANGCNVKRPGDLVVDPLTHLNLAFVNFGADFRLIDDYPDLVSEAAFLKVAQTGLRINIAIGGWAFNDPPTASRFSEMAASYGNRQVFISSVVSYLRKYGLDGVDIDWEYPVASDRGGAPEDADNYVQLVADMRKAFSAENPGWQITVTIPTSYWYLRGFHLDSMQKYVDWFNLMSYDLHGMWDHDNKWTGPYIQGHTDISEIDNGLDLLWRNDVKPGNVVFGMAFYGRSFTLADPSCTEPNGVCQFSTGGIPGSCSATAGILTYQEIAARNNSLDVSTHYDPETTVKYNVYSGSQWVSYDDAQSWNDKKKFLSRRGLSGIMIWAVDQDNGTFSAMEGLMGDFSNLQLEGGRLSPEDAAKLAKAFSAYTGQDCFVTPRCTDGSDGQQGRDQVCGDGFLSVDTAHTPLQAPGHSLHGQCSTGWYRHICCPKDAMPKNCAWNGAPEREVIGCGGRCGSNQFKLNEDSYIDASGQSSCYYGSRYICCDSTAIISDCIWSSCQGPLANFQDPHCPSGYDYQTFRLDKPDGSRWCSDEYISPVDGSKGSPVHQSFKSALCCPKGQGFANCNWSNDPVIATIDPILNCEPQPCTDKQVKVADAMDPPQAPATRPDVTFPVSCDGVSLPPGYDINFPFCCDPPSKYNKKWPVDPKDLWPGAYDDSSADVLWQYSDEFANNNHDREKAAPGAEDGTDAYGFVMLDGDAGSLDNSFPSTHTIVRRTREIPNTKRSLLTTNQTILDSVFDHSEEVVHVYCNYNPGSEQCNRIFIDGAEDTIIRLPNHVGEGPFARIIYMRRAESGFQLPDHHIEHRSLQNLHGNPVYEVKIDYNFHAITPKRDDKPVFIRVDYTNLLGYWDEMTTAPGPSSRRAKRSEEEKVASKTDWRGRVKRAATRDANLRKRSGAVNFTAPIDVVAAPDEDVRVERRWWGVFLDWLSRLTTVTKSSVGNIPMFWAQKINLFSASNGCPGQTFYANIKIDLEAEVAMETTYAYYLSGTFIPPSAPETYMYLSITPTASLMLRMEGNAILQAGTGRKKIIDTLAFPSLAVKGIAAVGPTLDVYGEVRGKVTLHGEAVAGASVSFGKAEVFWPQDDEAQEKFQTLVGLENRPSVPDTPSLEPTFEAGVRLDAQLDVIVTPEANVGIKIGGGSIFKGATLVDAQVTAYVRGDLSFQASGEVATTTQAFDYRYGVYIFYNLGYKATAQILGLVNWALAPREAYSPDKSIEIFSRTGSIPLNGGGSKRGEAPLIYGKAPSRGMRTIHSTDEANDGSDNRTMSPVPGLADDVFRRAVPPSGGTSTPPDFTQPVTCPPGSGGDWQLPELRFNCDLLSVVHVSPYKTAGSYRIVPGLCDGYRAIPNFRSVLTFINHRRTGLCGSGSCTRETTSLQVTTGRFINNPPGSTKGIQLQCDEYPFASSEEAVKGFLDSTQYSETCAPAYQNQWGGQCITLLGDLSSNWGRMEPTLAAADKFDGWVGWRDTKWTRNNAKVATGDVSATQRYALYPERMPVPDGGPHTDSDQVSWVFRRNYTVSLVGSSAQSTSWWGASGKAFKSGTNRGPAGLDGIVCALNTFGQDTYFKQPSTYNAWCLRDEKRMTKSGWPDVPRIAQCQVTFTSNTKRSIGNWGGWEVESIKYVDDLEDDVRHGDSTDSHEYNTVAVMGGRAEPREDAPVASALKSMFEATEEEAARAPLTDNVETKANGYSHKASHVDSKEYA